MLRGIPCSLEAMANFFDAFLDAAYTLNDLVACLTVTICNHSTNI